MTDLKTSPLPDREVHYFRQRYKNRLFEVVASFFAEEAERTRITEKDIAGRLGCDPSQVTRCLSAPGNLTLDSISDILLALGAEMDCRVVRFSDRPQRGVMHPMLKRVKCEGSSDGPANV